MCIRDRGTIYNKLAQYKDGINSYKKALKLNDNNARVYLSMGHALKTLGNRKECEDSYLKAIKLFPLSGEGYWSLANLKTYTFNESQIQAMKSAIKEDMHEQEKIQMMFALGKAYESKKNFKESFKFYNDGNWMQRKTVEYNAEENSKSIDLTIDFFKQNKVQLNFDSGIS